MMEPMPKPSLEEMLATISPQKLAQKVSDIHLEAIANALINWKSVCATLGISVAEETAIEEDNRTVDERRFVLLLFIYFLFLPYASGTHICCRIGVAKLASSCSCVLC